jgi:DNA repair exonuclease SbcCD ATPase subunit
MKLGRNNMSKINVKIENVSGLKAWNGSFERGKVNIILGSAASGKSSLLKGIQIAVAGSMKDALTSSVEERTLLNLDDKSDEVGIIHRGAKSARASVNTTGASFEVEIPRTGSLKATGNGIAEALTTTMLARLPATRIVREVFDGQSDDFSWMVDDLSDAAQYVTWQNTLGAIVRELSIKRSRYQGWAIERGSLDKELESLTSEIDSLKDARSRAQSTGDAANQQLEEELKAARPDASEKADKAAAKRNEYNEKERANQSAQQRVTDLERKIRQLNRSIEDNKGRQQPVRPDQESDLRRKMELEVMLASQTEKSAEDNEWAILAQQDHTDGHLSQKGQVYVKAMEVLGAESDEAVRELEDELRVLVNQITHTNQTYQTRLQEFVQADQRVREANGQKTVLEPQLTQAKQSMPFGESDILKTRDDMNALDRLAVEAQAKIETLEKELAQSGNATPELDTQIRALEHEKASKERAVPIHFNFRIESLRMTSLQSPNATLESASPFGTGNDLVGNADNYLRSRLRMWSTEDIQGDFLSFFNEAYSSGSLATFINEVEALETHCATQAESHRLKARNIFNQIGQSIFAKLSFSPMKSITLDGHNQLKVVMADGKETGLTGSEGERTLIAAAILIALREAYTPDIPMLMLDGILDNLNAEPREELINFLGAYATNKDIAIIATRLDDGRPIPEVI